MNNKTIFVTGGTGNQGGAAATSLLNNGFKIKVLTRNPESAQAQSLQRRNAELVVGDLNNIEAFRNHLKGVDGIFSVQTFVNGIEDEIKQGKDLANLAKEHDIKHFLYSSVAGAHLNTSIPHFESKFKIENYIKQINLPYTIIRPTSFFENFLLPQVKSRIVKGKLASPVKKDKIQQFISTIDIGEISADIFQNREKYLNKTITMGVEEMNMLEVAKVFSEVLKKEIVYQKLPMFITRLVMGKDLYKMFRWLNENDTYLMEDLEAFRKEHPKMIPLKQWIELNFNSN